ncbi:GNAT family N-acetyltransferase [Pseudoruegeria sp. HB172150]|uniref:GNAT family N-acetyltransferase n=1 Tax=Pseudoruegeria sp. HB172150 TaxID=2721164 RepID=UPI001551C198|nr:GNAT family N-acetyltransferase [Pseudoruegeria sp. HB172150]
MPIEIKTLTGVAVDSVLDDLARLRIEVFRAWPYLYDGDLAYEKRYMASYADSADAILVGAFDGARLVGAATGTPMEDHADQFAEPFAARGLTLTDIFYCAESVLLPGWRGQGIGHAFFDAREAHARALGRRYSVFCGVVRPGDHPMRPADYRPLDGFWHKRGYAPIQGAIARFSWKDVGDAAETEKPLQMWMRDL